MHRADERLGFMNKLRQRELLGKTPDLPAARDRRLVVEIHRVDIGPLFAVERHGDDLPALGVIAEAG